MAEEQYYELPQEKEIVAALVEGIPSNWCWIDGSFIATQDHYGSGRVAKHTRLVMTRYNQESGISIRGVIDAPFGEVVPDNFDSPPPNIVDIVSGDKIFSRVVFNRAGFEANELFMDSAKHIASHYIQLGYKGGLKAVSGYRDNDTTKNPEIFSFYMAETPKTYFKPVLPPHIKLEWDAQYGGKLEAFEPFLKFMEALRINRFNPLQLK